MTIANIYVVGINKASVPVRFSSEIRHVRFLPLVACAGKSCQDPPLYGTVTPFDGWQCQSSNGGSRNLKREAEGNVSAASFFVANAHNELCAFYPREKATY